MRVSNCLVLAHLLGSSVQAFVPAAPWAPSAAYRFGAPARATRSAAGYHSQLSQLSMSSAPHEGNIKQDPGQLFASGVRKSVLTLGAAAVVALSALGMGPADADAAQSGGRMSGGGSFRSAPSRSYSAPSRSYSAPQRSYGGGGGTSVLPIPVPVPYASPFSSPFSSPFISPFSPLSPLSPLSPISPFSPSVTVVRTGFGINPVDLLLIGGAGFVAYNLLKGRSGGGESWGEYMEDDEGNYSGGGSLGSGISVVKLQVALYCQDRSKNSILGQLQRLANDADTESTRGLSEVVSEIALALLRRQQDWSAAATEFEYFSRDAVKAESKFQQLAIKERSKVERETLVKVGGRDESAARQAQNIRPEEIGSSTQAVVTVLVAIRGDSLKKQPLNKGVTNASTLRNVLQQLAADALTDEGENVVAAELLWTPEEPWEKLDKRDIITDFPELVEL